MIAFNDDDDLWHPQKLEKQVEVFKTANQKVGVVYTGLNRIIKGKKKYFPESWVKKKEGNLYPDLFLENFISLPAAIIRRECFDKVGLFDEVLPRYIDWELWLRISQDYQFRFIDEPLVDSHLLSGGITRNKRVLFQATQHIFKKHQKTMKKDKEVLAAWQFRLGDLDYHQGRMKKARELFIQALKNKTSFKYFRAIIKTFLGKGISETLISWKISLVKNWQILAILVLALLLRLINLNQSLWLDEAVQVITSRGSFLNIFQELRGDFHPPLYHLLMWVWVHLFGSREIVLRLPSVIFGVATVYVAYLIGKVVSEQWLVVSKKQNQPPATSHQPLPLLAAIFMATAPFHIYYSQEARNYALTTFLAALSMYFFVRLVRSWEFGDRRREIGDGRWENSRLRTPGLELQAQNSELRLGYLLSTTLLLYTNYFGLFILLAQALLALIQRRRKQLWLIFYCLLLFAPDLILLRTQLLTGHQATTSLPEWGRLVNLNFLKALPLTFIKFSIGRITIFNKKIYAIVAVILFIVYGAIIVRGFFQKKRFIIHNSLFIILSWLLVPIFCAWLISFFIPNYQPFRLLLVLPAFYLLLALGVSRIKITMYRCIVIVFILLVNLIAVSVYYINPYFYREDWRGLVQFIESQPKEEKVAILPSYNSYWPYEYYSASKVSLVGLSDSFRMVEERDVEEKLSRYSTATLYYIRYLVPMFDPQEQTVSWLNQNGFVKIKEVSFNQIPVWVYELGDGSQETGVRR